MYMVVSITFGQYGIYLYIIKRINTVTLWDLMECLSFALAHSKVIFKCLMFWFNQHSGVFFANDDITNNVTEVHFNTKIDFPFEINTQRTYKLILVIESLVLFTFSWSTGTVNCMLLILIMHIAGQINIVRRWLTEIAFSENTGKDKSISITMTKIIQKHKKIIRFSKKIQSLYMHIALVQFLLNTIMICAIAFLVVTAVGSPDAVKQIVKCFFFYVTTNLEAYIFCFAGEYLKNKSREIGIAAYSTAWYNMKSKDSRVLLFIILRSQKELTLTAGNMMELSLQSFTSIMNISGSYLSVLLAMR
ncbi:odorant receptor 10-like [Cardiocondyla obscurior]|uniref:odorant receptor 10-like n=1 Tax=Cardiocondyla obscurior TaxID=286306 RepID=UPI0039655BB9